MKMMRRLAHKEHSAALPLLVSPVTVEIGDSPGRAEGYPWWR